MNLLEMLESLGDRLGIVAHLPPEQPNQAPKIETRILTLSDLAHEIRREEIKSLAEMPAELSIPLDKILETAGIPSYAHGWTIEKLGRLISSDSFKGLDHKTAQSRVLAALEEAKAVPEDLVLDAIARDQALDAFEKFSRQKMDDRLAIRQRRLCEIESHIAGLKAEAAGLEDQTQSESSRWKEWKKQKREREQDLARWVGYLIDKPVITTDSGEE
jgi:hypothetical protein